eukprot:46893-Chlamydomonas_euryale.AAC.1
MDGWSAQGHDSSSLITCMYMRSLCAAGLEPCRTGALPLLARCRAVCGHAACDAVAYPPSPPLPPPPHVCTGDPHFPSPPPSPHVCTGHSHLRVQKRPRPDGP